MNERLRELMLEAGYAAPELAGRAIKLSELIVKECMNLVKDCYAESESGKSPYLTACAPTIIEEHFGVE